MIKLPQKKLFHISWWQVRKGAIFQPKEVEIWFVYCTSQMAGKLHKIGEKLFIRFKLQQTSPLLCSPRKADKFTNISASSLVQTERGLPAFERSLIWVTDWYLPLLAQRHMHTVGAVGMQCSDKEGHDWEGAPCLLQVKPDGQAWLTQACKREPQQYLRVLLRSGRWPGWE